MKKKKSSLHLNEVDMSQWGQHGGVQYSDFLWSDSKTGSNNTESALKVDTVSKRRTRSHVGSLNRWTSAIEDSKASPDRYTRSFSITLHTFSDAEAYK